MNGAAFSIELFPDWKDAISKSGITQENIDNAFEKLGPKLLEDHGFKHSMDRLKVYWGEWGPEHIYVPGNACGLDITKSSPFGPRGGALLSPHNVDSLRQASLILSIFLWIANCLVVEIKLKKSE
ncbi:hypothetical protein MYP_673 [Sporocytophaga myxococcoides]|uniref:Uncharacterized protein n=2 Tax=Sporocytophaga myxococcoides TaxID=153721 RepID=A0A098L979_9BACT|nr:hypothetical protein MYP_673 [Sporocytophaga myxococcoides]